MPAVRIESSANFYIEHLFTVNCNEEYKILIPPPVVNLIKHFTIIIYDFRVVWLENCPYYDSRVVIYARKMFTRLSTDPSVHFPLLKSSILAVWVLIRTTAASRLMETFSYKRFSFPRQVRTGTLRRRPTLCRFVTLLPTFSCWSRFIFKSSCLPSRWRINRFTITITGKS